MPQRAQPAAVGEGAEGGKLGEKAARLWQLALALQLVGVRAEVGRALRGVRPDET